MTTSQVCFTRGTSNDYKLEQIENFLNKEVRVSLKDRVIFGMLVECHDHKDLLRKGMVRFVMHERIDSFFADGKTMHTRIFNFNDFQVITEYEEKK